MSARRVLGLFLIILMIIAAIAVIWYMGSQKTVYGLTALTF